MIMPFGKYKNQDIENIPTDYLRWLVQDVNLHEGSAIEAELSYREDHNCHFYGRLRNEN